MLERGFYPSDLVDVEIGVLLYAQAGVTSQLA